MISHKQDFKHLQLLIFILVIFTIKESLYAQFIITTNPTANQLNVDPLPNIIVELSSSIERISISDISFVVYGNQTGIHKGVFSYNDSSTIINYVPDKPFLNGEIVKVILTKNIIFSTGDSLINPYLFNFTIKSTGGTGIFQEKFDYDTRFSPISCVGADFDQDNDLDVAVANYSIYSKYVSVYLNDGSGVFINKTDYPTGDYANCIASADFDRDGDMDLALAYDYWNYDLSIFLNNGKGIFDIRKDYIPGSGRYPSSIFCEDFNGDGYLDISITYCYDDSVGILLNNQKGEFYQKECYEAGDSPISVFTLDFDHDYDMDLAIANYLSFPLSILPNINRGKFGSKKQFGTPSSGKCICAADINSDSNMDLIIANEGQCNFSVYLNNGSGDFSLKTDYGSLLSTNSLYSADLNGDGYLDIAVNALGDPNQVSIFTNNGDGTLNHQADFSTVSDPRSIFCGDFDSDGDLDIILVNFTLNNFSIINNLNHVNRISSSDEMPNALSLRQCYPNPTNSKTMVKFSLPSSEFVSISIFDILGRKVDNILSKKLSAGSHSILINAEKYTSGIYFYNLRTSQYHLVKKFIILK